MNLFWRSDKRQPRNATSKIWPSYSNFSSRQLIRDHHRYTRMYHDGGPAVTYISPTMGTGAGLSRFFVFKLLRKYSRQIMWNRHLSWDYETPYCNNNATLLSPVLITFLYVPLIDDKDCKTGKNGIITASLCFMAHLRTTVIMLKARERKYKSVRPNKCDESLHESRNYFFLR